MALLRNDVFLGRKTAKQVLCGPQPKALNQKLCPSSSSPTYAFKVVLPESRMPVRDHGDRGAVWLRAVSVHGVGTYCRTVGGVVIVPGASPCVCK